MAAKGTDQCLIIRKEWWKGGADRPYGFLIKRLIKITNAFFSTFDSDRCEIKIV